MEARLQEIEKSNQEKKQSMKKEEVDENTNLRDKNKELEDKLMNNMALNSVENKLDIKPIKKEMNKIIELDHEHNKRDFNLTIFSIKELNDDETLAILKKELKNKEEIETIGLIEARTLGEII
jgi:hypothetical protein